LLLALAPITGTITRRSIQAAGSNLAELLWHYWRFCKDSPSRNKLIASQAVLLRKFLR
jgi:hypothetical protein